MHSKYRPRYQGSVTGERAPDRTTDLYALLQDVTQCHGVCKVALKTQSQERERRLSDCVAQALSKQAEVSEQAMAEVKEDM